jgi:hypothetical protein
MNKHGAIAIHGTMPHPSQGKSGWALRFFEVGLGDGRAVLGAPLELFDVPSNDTHIWLWINTYTYHF